MEMGIQTRKESKGRHPLLKLGSLAHQVYTTLANAQADMTIDALARACNCPYQTMNGCIQRMKGEGLIINTTAQKGNRVIATYKLVTENVTGDPRDKVQLRTVVYVNSFGEYSAKTMVVGESPLAHESNPQPIHQYEHYTAVPRPREPYATRTVVPQAAQIEGPTEHGPKTIDVTPVMCNCGTHLKAECDQWPACVSI